MPEKAIDPTPLMKGRSAMKNKRSSRLLAWFLTMVMIFNIAPTSVFAEDQNEGQQNLAESGMTTNPVIVDVTESAGIRVSDGNLVITIPNSDKLPYEPTDQMVCTIPDGVTITASQAAAMSNETVECVLSADGQQLVFLWKNDKAEGFTVSMPLSATTHKTLTPGDNEYIIRYQIPGKHTYDGNPVLLADDVMGTLSYSAITSDQNAFNNKEKSELKDRQFTGTSPEGHELVGHIMYMNYAPTGSQEIQVHYLLIYNDESGKEQIETFQLIQNGEAEILFDHETNTKDSLDVPKFLGTINGGTPGNNLTISNKYAVMPFYLPESYMTLGQLRL